MAAKKTHTEKWLARFEKGPRVPMASIKKKKPQQRTLKSPLESVLEEFKFDNPHLEDSVLNEAFDAKEQFMKDWLNEQDEDESLTVEQIEAVEEAIDQALQQAYTDSVYFKRGEALVDAAQRMADSAEIESQFSFDRDSGEVIVELDKSFLKAWEEATSGVGMFEWENGTTLADVKNVSTVLDVLDAWANVHGTGKRLERMYSDEWDRWEPGGNLRYHHLVKIAEDALKGARK